MENKAHSDAAPGDAVLPTTEGKRTDLLPGVLDDKGDKTRGTVTSPADSRAQSASLSSSAAPVSQYAIIVNPVQVCQRTQMFVSL